jgi:hypothetical protein
VIVADASKPFIKIIQQLDCRELPIRLAAVSLFERIDSSINNFHRGRQNNAYHDDSSELIENVGHVMLDRLFTNGKLTFDFLLRSAGAAGQCRIVFFLLWVKIGDRCLFFSNNVVIQTIF